MLCFYLKKMINLPAIDRLVINRSGLDRDHSPGEQMSSDQTSTCLISRQSSKNSHSTTIYMSVIFE